MSFPESTIIYHQTLETALIDLRFIATENHLSVMVVISTIEIGRQCPYLFGFETKRQAITMISMANGRLGV